MTAPAERRYRRMPRPRVSEGACSILAVQDDHIEAIRVWRNAQMDVLRQAAPITPAAQSLYFETAIWPEMTSERPRNILVSFLEAGRLVGYGGLVHIAWDENSAEVSFLLDPALTTPAHAYASYFTRFLTLLKRVAFDDLGLARLTTETYDLRPDHIRALEGQGFRREGVLKDHVTIGGRKVDSILHSCAASGNGQAEP